MSGTQAGMFIVGTPATPVGHHSLDYKYPEIPEKKLLDLCQDKDSDRTGPRTKQHSPGLLKFVWSN